jgi:RNA polymerase-interacting CarD/CdnL/TRCF family regulator
MNLIEKRDFIHSRLHQADESLINEFYEILHKKEVLKTKLINRAQKSENDIKSGKIFSRAEIERRTNNAIRQ